MAPRLESPVDIYDLTMILNHIDPCFFIYFYSYIFHHTARDLSPS